MSNDTEQNDPDHRPAVGGQVQRVVRRWDRRLWGVEFSGSRTDDAPMLIGRLWALDLGGNPYHGEPTRALLFCTRQHARTWCAETMLKWRDGGDIVRRWLVRPVRVRETVQVEAPNPSSRGSAE